MSDTIIPSTDVEALKAWASDVVLALAVERARVETLPEFNEWASEQEHPWTREYCLWKWVDEYPPQLPDYPNAPDWCETFDVHPGGYQEITIWLRGVPRERDGIRVRREQMLTLDLSDAELIPIAEPPFIEILSTDRTVDLPNLYIHHAQTLVELLAEIGVKA